MSGEPDGAAVAYDKFEWQRDVDGADWALTPGWSWPFWRVFCVMLGYAFAIAAVCISTGISGVPRLLCFIAIPTGNIALVVTALLVVRAMRHEIARGPLLAIESDRLHVVRQGISIPLASVSGVRLPGRDGVPAGRRSGFVVWDDGQGVAQETIVYYARVGEQLRSCMRQFAHRNRLEVREQ